MKLTQANVARLKLPEGKSDHLEFDDEIPGFGLRLRAGGKRTWLIQYRVGAKQRRHAFGTVETLSADKARKEAMLRLARVKLGGDPQQEKHITRARAGETVGKLIEDYLARRHYETGKDPLRKSSYEAVEHYLRKHCKVLHEMQASKIDRSAIASRLTDIEAKISSVTAARVRAALNHMFAWAVGQGTCDSNPVIGTNRPPEPTARDRVLSDGELADIWAACREDDFGRIVKLLLLTGCRRDEIGDLQAAELDLAAAVINLPPERVKNGLRHVVPLAPLAVEILKCAPRRARHGAAADYIFGEGEGGFSGWSKAKDALDERINAARLKAWETSGEPGERPAPIAAWRLHDLRHTVSTVMNDSPVDEHGKPHRGLGVEPWIVEAVINHISGHRRGMAGRYNHASYLPEKRRALSLWGDYVRSIVEGAERKIVPLWKGA
jgi:integrase